MRMGRRLAAAAALLAGGVGLAACVAGVVGTWRLYFEAKERVDRTFGRAIDSLGTVRTELVEVRDRLRETRREVDDIRKREEDLAARPPAERGGRRGASRKAAEDSSPRLGEARKKLVAATELALVVNGTLDALGELPFSGERVGVDAGRLRDAADGLSDVIGRADNLADLLARSSGGEGAANTELPTRIVERLDRVNETLDDGAERVAGARGRVEAAHTRVVRWLRITAVAVTLLLVWIGAGQFFLLAAGWRGLWRRKAPVTPPAPAVPPG